jgi:hypothetical protein
MAMSCGDYRAAELVLAEDQLSARADFFAEYRFSFRKRESRIEFRPNQLR